MNLNEEKEQKKHTGLKIAGIGSALVIITTILANTTEIWKNTKESNKTIEKTVIEETTENQKIIETVITKEMETIFIKESETEAIPTESLLPTPEEFLESAYNMSDVVLYLGEHGKSFNMNGRTYHTGIKFKDIPLGSGYGQHITFNVEKLDSISFTIGHIDNERENGGELLIYTDDELYDTIEISGNMKLNEYNLDVSQVANIYFYVDAYGAYGLGDISIE